MDNSTKSTPNREKVSAWVDINTLAQGALFLSQLLLGFIIWRVL